MLDQLRSELVRYRLPPHLLTTGDDGRAHAVAIDPHWDGEQLRMRVGKRSLANVAARKLVSVLWSPPTGGDYSLIVDGDGEIITGGAEAEIRITITRAVLHRPGAPAVSSGNACGSDCVPLFG